MRINPKGRSDHRPCAGGPGFKWVDELGALRVGFTRGAFDLVVPGFYPLTESMVTVRYNPPRVNPTRGAPSVFIGSVN